jgi:ABC-type sugar transport system ATPase subunit
VLDAARHNLAGGRPMLEFGEIRKSFFGVPVLKGVSFRVEAGRTSD